MADPNVVLSASAAKKMRRAVQQVLSQAPHSADKRRFIRTVSQIGAIPLRISTPVSSSQGGRYYAKSYVGTTKKTASGNFADADIGTISSAATAIVWNLNEIGRSTHHISSTVSSLGAVMAFPTGVTDTASGLPIYLVNIPPLAMFPVSLTQTGGSNGNQTVAATWTYTALSLTGDTIGTGLTPLAVRPYGTFSPATNGMGYYNAFGNFILAMAFEYPGIVGCPT